MTKPLQPDKALSAPEIKAGAAPRSGLWGANVGKTASPVVWEKYHRMFAEFSKPGAQKLRTIAIKHGVLNTGSVYAAFQKIRNGTAPYPPPADLRGPVLKPNGKIL